ncbi:crotonase/enoyl-CoA hydratase family protein [Achromobacter pestifer]|uniref:Crotonase/enoyl-CoA hydratase family protein n=1 Tax=Achromobacter pestifer TaxID=1353889 RepID=A0A7D4DY73_9BURK|nr:crotonase/enoyl-CoA hydratase family protein [Achromobacter pestifer]QKH36472.1 crotonase/enoyl-CoA hydratase family protein [Achromobacter pestifer]
MTEAKTENDEVLLESSEGILTITLNRPQARNAVTLAVARAIAAAVDELDRRDDLRIGILTGAGGSFCAGMDLKGFLRGERPSIDGRGFGGLTMRPPKKPLIAAVEGYALAGGFELVLACDMVVAAENAQFGVPEVKRGLAATAGGLVRLPRQLPYRVAMELALTGDMFPATRALGYGLINQVSAPGEALERARELARRIVANGPQAVAASKRVIVASQGWPADEVWSRQAELTEHVFTSADAREGSAAFAEKRAPVWQGR